MNRYSARVLTGVALFACAGVLTPACVHDDSTLFIRSVQLPPQSTGGSCIYTPDPTQPALFNGELDLAFTNRYEAVLLVGNQMTPEGDPVQARTETSRIEIQKAIVKIKDVNGVQLAAYSTATSGTIDPASGTSPSYGLVNVEAIDPGTAARLLGVKGTAPLPSGDSPVTVGGGQQQVISFIQVLGQTLGGQSVESNEFQFPITVCLGCEVQNLVGTTTLTCAASTSGTTTTPCLAGQDGPVDCNTCGSNPYCVCGAASCNGSGVEPPPDAGTD